MDIENDPIAMEVIVECSLLQIASKFQLADRRPPAKCTQNLTVPRIRLNTQPLVAAVVLPFST
jgi:hypothetical protein